MQVTAYCAFTNAVRMLLA